MWNSKTRYAVAAIAILSFAVVGRCTATQKGAGIGAAAGAAVGAAIGSQSDNTGKGAAIGAAAGAVAGGLIGHYMDQQAKDLSKIPGVKAERIGDEIKVTWESAILFDFASSSLKTESQTNLKQMCDVLNDYPETELVVSGHTDSKGSDSYNETLSKRRADAVGEFLIYHQVAQNRVKTMGYGENRPVAPNDTDDGRAQNRRVEIEIRANEDLKAQAEAQAKQ